MSKYELAKILVVEDNQVNQMVVREMLKALGVIADFASDGNEAINMAPKGYDLIFMDIQMPNKNGFDTTKELKSLLADKCPPIIAMTANVFQEDRDKCVDAGMIDFLPKPVNKTSLKQKLEKFLDQNQTAAS